MMKTNSNGMYPASGMALIRSESVAVAQEKITSLDDILNKDQSASIDMGLKASGFKTQLCEALGIRSMEFDFTKFIELEAAKKPGTQFKVIEEGRDKSMVSFVQVLTNKRLAAQNEMLSRRIRVAPNRLKSKVNTENSLLVSRDDYGSRTKNKPK